MYVVTCDWCGKHFEWIEPYERFPVPGCDYLRVCSDGCKANVYALVQSVNVIAHCIAMSTFSIQVTHARSCGTDYERSEYMRVMAAIDKRRQAPLCTVKPAGALNGGPY